MARSDSTIRVNIIGDASKLAGAFKDADKATGGLIGSTAKVVGGALIAGAAVDKVFDIAQSSLDKADDFNDKLDTLSKLTTPQFASRLHDVAFGMSDIGLSAQDVADGATAFASYATAAKVSMPTIEAALPTLLDVAEAIHAKTGKSVAEVIDDIGKAAGGNQKSVSDYGIVVDKTLNPDDRILDILNQAVGLYGDAKSATNDLEGAQDKANAKVDNFSIKLGEALEGPMTGLAGIGLEILDELKDWPGAIGQFGDALGQVLSPLARVRDAVDGILRAMGDVGDFAFGGTAGPSPSARLSGRTGPTEADVNRAVRNHRERNGLSESVGGF